MDTSLLHNEAAKACIKTKDRNSTVLTGKSYARAQEIWKAWKEKCYPHEKVYTQLAKFLCLHLYLIKI